LATAHCSDDKRWWCLEHQGYNASRFLSSLLRQRYRRTNARSLRAPQPHIHNIKLSVDNTRFMHTISHVQRQSWHWETLPFCLEIAESIRYPRSTNTLEYRTLLHRDYSKYKQRLSTIASNVVYVHVDSRIVVSPETSLLTVSVCRCVLRMYICSSHASTLPSSTSGGLTHLPPVLLEIPSALYHRSLTQPGFDRDGRDIRASFISMPLVIDMLCQLHALGDRQSPSWRCVRTLMS
jgi:hypothetical protein